MLSSDQIKIERIVKNSASSFYWGMKSLSKEKKRAMFSIYAFCRIVDDIADNFQTQPVTYHINSHQLKITAFEGELRKQKIPKTVQWRQLWPYHFPSHVR